MTICACGCGKEIPWKRHHKYHPPQYLHNHHPHRLGDIRSQRRIEPGTLCACGCGQIVPLFYASGKPKYKRGESGVFVKNHKPQHPKGAASPKWKGGRRKHLGYWLSYCPDHPNSVKGYIQEHRLVMEKHLGRYLEPNEVVHHINHNPEDNRIENLMLMPQPKHISLHCKGKPSKFPSEHFRQIGRLGAGKRWKNPPLL